MKTKIVASSYPDITTVDAEDATPFRAAELLLEARLGRRSLSSAPTAALEKKAEAVLDPEGGITKAAYASAPPNLIALAREDRRRVMETKLRSGEVCEYVLRGLPDQTEWRTLHEWLSTHNLHPLQVVVPKGSDYAYVIVPATEANPTEALFWSTAPPRFNGAILRVQKANPRR